MAWIVEFHPDFKPEFKDYQDAVKLEIRALVKVLQELGPEYGRPRVDTLNSNKHSNLKELRFSAADGEWRVAFAFDPERKAILLVGGDKSGASQKRVYKDLIKLAEARFDEHLSQLQNQKKHVKGQKKEK